jgi:hypothetical protein
MAGSHQPPRPQLSRTLFPSKTANPVRSRDPAQHPMRFPCATDRNTAKNLRLATHQALLHDATMRIFRFNPAQQAYLFS